METAGTFPLPEAQLDRFMMKLSMGLPDREEELAILERYLDREPLADLTSVVTLEDLDKARTEAGCVYVHPCIREYMVELVAATRRGEDILMGVSPRGSLCLLRCAKAYAYLEGRGYVIPDDVRALAVPVLAHRIVMGFGAEGSVSTRELVEQIVASIPVPTEDFTK